MGCGKPTNSENGNNSNRPIYLDVDGTNPNLLWCVLTGTQTGHKILRSEDAGDTWQNWTTPTIASERVVSLAHQRGSNGGVYIGTTNAVYYRDADLDDWVLYNEGLPMINVNTFLQADYCGGHIRTAGTRGVHQAAFYAPSDVLAGFMADRTDVNLASPCQQDPIHFSAVSVLRCDGATYEWTFGGGTVLAIEGPEAWVAFDQEGAYDVGLTVTDADGATDTWTWEDLMRWSTRLWCPTTASKRISTVPRSRLNIGAWRSRDMHGSMHTTCWTRPTAWPSSPTTGSTPTGPSTCW